MTHSYGWQVEAGIQLAAQPGLWDDHLCSSPCRPLHSLVGLSHSMMTEFQKQVSQENKMEVHGIFMAWPQK